MVEHKLVLKSENFGTVILGLKISTVYTRQRALRSTLLVNYNIGEYFLLWLSFQLLLIAEIS